MTWRPRRFTLFPYTTLFRSYQRDERPLRGTDVEHVQGRQVPLIRSEEHTSELQSLRHLVCRLLLEKKKKNRKTTPLRIRHHDSNVILSRLTARSTTQQTRTT